jgi:uncharacterized protein (TIGR02246 family)
MSDAAKGRRAWPGQDAAAAAVRGALDGWIEAVNKSDADSIAALYVRDAVLLATFDPVVLTTPDQRLNYFVNFKARKKLKASVDECHIEMLGDNAGVASGLYTFRFIDEKGAPQTVHARFTYVYERQPEGKWLVIAHHSSVAPNP